MDTFIEYARAVTLAGLIVINAALIAVLIRRSILRRTAGR